jgi:hypothetical protein
MAEFPTLKTGAVAQYPSERSRSFSTRVYEFMDGAEQRFPEFGTALKRWVIRLDLLDEEEMLRLEEFFLEQAGASGSFSFVDPWDEAEYPSCSFEGDDLEMTFAGVSRGVMSVVVRENR